MRDPGEQAALIARLKCLWLNHPNLRLCQLISALVEIESDHWQPEISGNHCIFHVEDSQLSSAIINELKRDATFLEEDR